MEKTLITVMAHQEQQAAFNRHLELWRKHNCPIIVCCPTNARIATDLPLMEHSLAERAGLECRKRLIALLEHLLQHDFAHYIIFEYDSVSLSAKIHLGRGLFGIVFANAESPKFMAPRYPNPPWIMDRKSLEAICDVALTYPDVIECGEADRLLAAWAMLAGVPILDHQPKGYSRGTITGANFLELENAIHNGATMIHGVKHARALRAALDFYEEKRI